MGWFASAKYENGTQVAYVAAIQEFGDPSHNTPPRAGLRNTIAENKNKYSKMFNKLAVLVAKGAMQMEAAQEQIGLIIAGDFRKRISVVSAPPLKETTIQARLNKMADTNTRGNLDKPLVFTGVLLNTLSNAVVDSNDAGE